MLLRIISNAINYHNKKSLFINDLVKLYRVFLRFNMYICGGPFGVGFLD